MEQDFVWKISSLDILLNFIFFVPQKFLHIWRQASPLKPVNGGRATQFFWLLKTEDFRKYKLKALIPRRD